MIKLTLSDSELVTWVEQESSIHIKAITKSGDPVELSDMDVEKLVSFFTEYLK